MRRQEEGWTASVLHVLLSTMAGKIKPKEISDSCYGEEKKDLCIECWCGTRDSCGTLKKVPAV